MRSRSNLLFAPDQRHSGWHGLLYVLMNNGTRHSSAVFALVGCLMLISSQAGSSERHKVIAEGADDYKDYCSACHGLTGQGNGKMESILVKPPTDLTRIADHAGRFPFWRVYDIIAGDAPVSGHQTFQMPQFSTRLRKDEHKPGYLPAHIRVLLLTHYIESLQMQ